MNIRNILLGAALGLGSAASIAQEIPQAQGGPIALAPRSTSVRAGPSSGFPQVAAIGPGAMYNVGGCVANYSWCDVTMGALRGWVNAGALVINYQNVTLPLRGNGALLGIPVVSFNQASYWDQYYRGQPWYGQRGGWPGRYPNWQQPGWSGNQGGWPYDRGSSNERFSPYDDYR